MGTFTYSHIVSFLGNGDGANDPLSSIVSGTLTDGDMDTTFETGDNVSAGTIANPMPPTNGVYLGTTSINGQDWPVFYFASDNESIAFLTEAPMLPLPATLQVDENVTFNGACFLTGTRIATPDGDVAVENLQVGDLIVTHNGKTVPVEWVGYQTICTAFGPAERLKPVRIAAGALGPGLPARDLTLTADHALFVDGVLVNAGPLVNGTSVSFVPLSEFGESYVVYHVETAQHEVLLAEGMPAETFIDYGTRQTFDNYAAYLEHHGHERVIAELPYPRISSARLVPPAIRRMLDEGQAA